MKKWWHIKTLSGVMIMSLFAVQSMGVAGTPANEKPLAKRGDVLNMFKDPPASYRSTPLWIWNDRMTTKAIDEGLADLHRHGIGGVFIHPRPGLITPYLSEEWLLLCRHAVQTGKKLGMKIWLYDENSYPSGFAGGLVPEKMPDAKRAGLKMARLSELPRQFPSEPILILARDSSGFTDITHRVKTEIFGPGEYRAFTVIQEKPRAWHGGFTYVDLMRPEVTREFLDITLNAYKRVIGDEFGKVVPGVFQDEAEIRPAAEPGDSVVNYTPALFDRFQKKRGYDLRPRLLSLFEESGDWRVVRHDFYATLLELFIDGWSKPYYDYCTANNLCLTGHYWEHEWPRLSVNPDNMATVAYSHMPGIDILMNEFVPDVHAQFGNARAVKEIRSVANQLGRERTLSETFGAGGWEMSFADQKRIADWEYALGVNFMNQHLSYTTIKGARKRDHPPSFSYHEPWWKHYRLLADYYGRLSVALCAGEQRNRILVIEPTTTAWMYFSGDRNNKKLDTLGKVFQDFLNLLEAGQVEYDLGSEDILRNHGSVHDRSLAVGLRTYELVILPPGIQNLDEATVALLHPYLANGGSVLCCGSPPAFVDGRTSERLRELSQQYRGNWVQEEVQTSLEAINRLSPPAFVFRDTAGHPSSFPLLFHHRRVLEDCEVLFLANTSAQQCDGEILAPGRSCDKLDPFTGQASRYPSVLEGERITFSYSIPPGGSLLLCLRAAAQLPPKPKSLDWFDIPPRGEAKAKRLKPNVLTLDYCDITIGDTTDKDLYFYEAQQRAFRHHGLPRNPWDGAVQFKTRILDQDRFEPTSGFEAAFHCVVAQGVKTETMRGVVERPGIFRVLVNGKRAKQDRGKWWLDKAFGVFDIGKLLRKGDNTITVRSSPFTIHSELEPMYLLGDFSLEKSQKGFLIQPAGDIQHGSWSEQGMPFYADGVSYTEKFDLSKTNVDARRFAVRLGKWNGVLAEVAVNERDAGVIAFPPYELDVTRLLRPGRNKITVTVIGSLKNTLGPHHNNPPLGRAWPGQFQQGAKGGIPPGASYSTVGYGLFEDFFLRSAEGGAEVIED